MKSIEYQRKSDNTNHVGGAKKMIGHAGIYAFGNMSRSLVGFIMLPVYTRYLSPADYGVLGLMAFTISLIEIIFGARLGSSIPKFFFDKDNDTRQYSVISTALLLTGFITAFTSLVLIMYRDVISQIVFGTHIYATIFAFFSILIFTGALENYALIYIRIQQRPWLYITVNITKLAMQLGLNVWLIVFEGMGVTGAAISAMLSSSVFSLFLLIYTIKHVGVVFNSEIALKMIKFSWPLWVASFAMIYIGSSGRYYLRLFSSLDDIGFYELASKFATIITLLIWQPFSQYWQIERFRYYHRGEAETVFQNVFFFISTMLILAAFGISLFSGHVIYLMADPSFYSSVDAVPFLSFGTVFYCMIPFFNFGFVVKEKTGFIARNNYLTVIIISVLFLVFIPSLGFVGAAVALMLAQAIQLKLVHRSSRIFYDMHINLSPFYIKVCLSIVFLVFINWLLSSCTLYISFFIKIAIFLIFLIFMICPVIKRSEVRNLLHEIIPRFFSKPT